MKPILFLAAAFAFFSASAQQDKSARPSPPASVKQTLESGATVSIDYSQPSVKGRTIGKDLEPLEGKIWRTGANEATVFEVDKEIKVEDQTLPAGKYALFTIKNGDDWTLIFNKTWKQWGAFNYKETDDALRVKVKGEKLRKPAEQLAFTIEKDGDVLFVWGEYEVEFKVK